ncbi:hypothetical protein Acor_48740 [Acrocarpospora corrugata]|uniref:DUF4331 domain-containing protein n=1 Tax=Acrocarpospora corrugata TaxID=35763 RepID=A0A5M3W8K2_9ACTN|nr:DUF4331 domain-containing protein [Acrocarpospora corrugata]GES02808.1 hypothetical protein Acor_48740 [Acrocarpospora corrugata]
MEISHGSRTTLAVGAGGAILLATIAGSGPSTVQASSHLDTLLLAADPAMDTTDLYAFTSPDKPDTVTFIANYFPLQAPLPSPTYRFATNAYYDLNIDSDGTGRPSLTYRWTFKNTGVFGLDTTQAYTLQELRPGQPPRTLVSDGIAPRASAGPFGDFASLRDKAVVPLPGGGQTYAGQATDPFFFDFKIAGMLRLGFAALLPKTDLGLQENIQTLAIQVPKKALALNGDPRRNPVIGVTTAAGRASLNLFGSGGGRYRQVSRMGNPNFCDAIIPELAPHYNTITPAEDNRARGLIDAVRKPRLPHTIAISSGAKAPAEPRTDLEEIFLTGLTTKANGPIRVDLNSQLLNQDADPRAFAPADELRLNMATPVTPRPNRFGLLGGDEQGFPNGRRLGDDVGAITVRMLMGEPAGPGAPQLGESPVTGPGTPTGPAFPYVALPLLQRAR